MLGCSDGDVSTSKSETNHLDDINAFPSVFGPGTMSVALHQRQELSARPGVVRAPAAGTNPNIDILKCLASVRHGSFPFSGSENAVVFPATGAPNPRFSHQPRRGSAHYPKGITWTQDFTGPQEQPHFVMRILPHSARVRVTWKLGHAQVHPRIDLARAESREGLKEDGKWEAKV
jgi:hypothetical protein